MTEREHVRDALALLGGAALLYAGVSTFNFILSVGSFQAAGSVAAKSIVGSMMTAIRALPAPAAALEAVLDGALDGLRDELAPPSPSSRHALPDVGLRPSEVAASLQAGLDADAARNGMITGTAFGGIYHSLGPDSAGGSESMHSLHATVSKAFLDTNMLYPGLFSTARRAEAEAVAMVVALLRDGPDGAGGGARAPAACGILTSGGTESILLAVKAHRDAALVALGYSDGIRGSIGGGGVGSSSDSTPAVALAARDGRILTVLAGATAHPALDKACALFGLRLRKLPVDERTLALAPAAVAAALDGSTVLVVASAPGFAHGVVDDVPAIAAVAAAYAGSPWGARGVPVHVDNCLGGMLLSFSPVTPPFDFRAHSGVASVSLDLHKYGGAPKGVSVVAFRDAERRRAAYSACATFPGGLYATPTLAGSRGGTAPALAWATLVATGTNGYARAAARVHAAHAALAEGVAATPGLRLLGTPHACVVAFAPAAGARFSSHALVARMAARGGWKLSLLQAPAGAHVVVTERFAEPWRGAASGGTTASVEPPAGAAAAEAATSEVTVGDRFLLDLRAAAADASAAPFDAAFEGKGEAAIYGAAGLLPEGEIEGVLKRYCDVLTAVR